MQRRSRVRRFKLPVVSTLTQAWLAFTVLVAGIAVYTASDAGRRRAAIAMTIDGVETIAPFADNRPSIAERLDRQNFTREAGAMPPAGSPDAAYGADTQDALEAIDAAAPAMADPASDIVITVDGRPAKSIGSASAVLASLGSAPIAEPDAALLIRTAYGNAPRIAEDGRRASKQYARPFAPGDDPHVAIIVGGLGLNRALTERAINELPAGVTLAFAPYAKDLAFWAQRARAEGHEFMVEIPMENRSGEGEALGPATLLTSRSEQENLQRLDWILSRTEGYFGVTNYLGATFAADRDAMAPVLERLAAAGLVFVDDTGALKGKKGAVATVSRLIDPGFGSEKGRTIRDLESLEKIAEREGEALGKTYVNGDTLGAIADWADGLGARGLALAPASAVLAIRSGAS